LFADLCTHPGFRQNFNARFRDLRETPGKLFYNPGPSCTAATLYQTQRDVFAAVAKCESARWGNGYERGAATLPLDSQWVKDNWFQLRDQFLLRNLVEAGLYLPPPVITFDPPLLNAPGSQIYITAHAAPGVRIAYTTDDSDPTDPANPGRTIVDPSVSGTSSSVQPVAGYPSFIPKTAIHFPYTVPPSSGVKAALVQLDSWPATPNWSEALYSSVVTVVYPN
jgi:hypothetical protein